MYRWYWLDDEGILNSISDGFSKTGYTIDPHGAVGWKAWSDIKNGQFEKLESGLKNDYTQPGLTPNLPEWSKSVTTSKNALGIILETAHPAKFGSIVEKATGQTPGIPERLEKILKLQDKSIPMENDYSKFKDWLLNNLEF